MKMTLMLRLLGGFVLFFNLWLMGENDEWFYNGGLIGNIATLLLTFGFAFAFELFVVKPFKGEKL